MMNHLMESVESLLIVFGLRILWMLPESFVRELACLVGWALSETLRSRRRIIEQNLRIAFGPDLSPSRIAHIRQQCWINICLTAAEVLRFPCRSVKYLRGIRMEGMEHLENSLSGGRGAILVTAHLGNWELVGAWLAQRVPFGVIARPLNQKPLARLLDDLRAQMGMTVFAKKSALKGVLSFLRRGGLVAFMLDQHAGRQSVTVPFFGQPAKTVTSVAMLAVRTGAAVHLGYTWRTPDGGIHARVHPAFQTESTGDLEHDILEATAQYTLAIETAIREHPECWLWMHRRWRKPKPAGIQKKAPKSGQK